MSGLFSSPKQPAPVNPVTAATAQTGSNVETAIANTALNNPNIVSPYGTTLTKQTGTQKITLPDGTTRDVPTYTQTQSLSPAEQKIYDQQVQGRQGLNDLANQQINFLTDHLGRPINMNQLPDRGQLPTSGPMFGQLGQGPNFANLGNQGPIQSRVNLRHVSNQLRQTGDPRLNVGPQDWSADRQRVEEAFNARGSDDAQRRRAQLQTELVNRGHQPGTPAFENAMREWNESEVDRVNQGVLLGGQEQSRLAGLDFNQFGLENAAQQQMFDQAEDRGRFGLDATAQNNAATLGGAQFANQAQAQRFGQAGDIAQFNNANAQRKWENANQRTMYGNDSAQRAFANATSLSQMNDQQRQQALAEMIQMRNQPINEISALMNGGQATPYQGPQFQGGQIATTPVGQMMYSSNDQARQNAMMDVQRQNAMFGALGSIGGAALGGWARGGFSNPFGGWGQA